MENSLPYQKNANLTSILAEPQKLFQGKTIF